MKCCLTNSTMMSHALIMIIYMAYTGRNMMPIMPMIQAMPDCAARYKIYTCITVTITIICVVTITITSYKKKH